MIHFLSWQITKIHRKLYVIVTLPLIIMEVKHGDSFCEAVKSMPTVAEPQEWLMPCLDGIGSDVVEEAIFTDFIVVIKDCLNPPKNAPCRFAIPATFLAACLDGRKSVGLSQ